MQNMVKMSRLETGILQIHQENKRIYETIRRAIASLVPQAALKQIDRYVFFMTVNGPRKQFIIFWTMH